MLTGLFQDSDFIVVLQTGFGSGSLPLGSGLDLDSKKLEAKYLCPPYDVNFLAIPMARLNCLIRLAQDHVFHSH